MGDQKPSELLPGLLKELEDLRRSLEAQRGRVETEAWANPLFNTSTDFLRRFADFRDGVQKAREIYPDEWFEQVASPDLDDPDLMAWHELTEWFVPEIREEGWE